MEELAQPAAESNPVRDEWAQIFDNLRQRYPGASDGVLFCIHKLQQNSDLKLRDFKDEAALHRVPLSGRSYHSARVLLGLEKPTPPRVREEVPADVARPGAPRTGAAPSTAALIAALDLGADQGESPLVAALKNYQAQTDGQLEAFRAAVRQALAVIDAALGD